MNPLNDKIIVEPEIISSKADNVVDAMLDTIVQTHNVFVDRFKEDKESSIKILIYLRDVSFLLKVVDLLLTNIKEMENKSDSIK